MSWTQINEEMMERGRTSQRTRKGSDLGGTRETFAKCVPLQTCVLTKQEGRRHSSQSRDKWSKITSNKETRNEMWVRDTSACCDN